jgi:hypothetical protein
MTKLARGLLVGSVVALPAVASAEQGDVGFQVETAVASSYVQRGIVQYASRTAPSSQTTAGVHVDHVGPGTLAMTGWTAVAMDEYDAQPGNSLEVDLSVTYAMQARSLTVTVGYLAALFPRHMDGTPFDGTHEVSAMVSYDNPYVVPAVAANVEVAHQQGVYLVLGASRDLRAGAWTFSPAVSAGAATYRKYQGGDQAVGPHLNDVTAGGAVRRDFDGGVYAAVRLSYAYCGTPSEIMSMDADWNMGGRSTVVGVLAVGVAR